MSCAFEEDLTAYLDAELPALRQRQVDEHLPGCAACGATLRLLQRSVAQLPLLPALPPAPQTRRQLLERLEEKAPWWRRFSLWAPGLGMAAAAGLVVALAQGGGPTQQADSLEAVGAELSTDDLADFDVLGLDEASDVDVVAQLHELEREESR